MDHQGKEDPWTREDVLKVAETVVASVAVVVAAAAASRSDPNLMGERLRTLRVLPRPKRAIVVEVRLDGGTVVTQNEATLPPHRDGDGYADVDD